MTTEHPTQAEAGRELLEAIACLPHWAKPRLAEVMRRGVDTIDALQRERDGWRDTTNSIVTEDVAELADEVASLRSRIGELEGALKLAHEAIETGRSEPLFIARDVIRQALTPSQENQGFSPVSGTSSPLSPTDGQVGATDRTDTVSNGSN